MLWLVTWCWCFRRSTCGGALVLVSLQRWTEGGTGDMVCMVWFPDPIVSGNLNGSETGVLV